LVLPLDTGLDNYNKLDNEDDDNDNNEDNDNNDDNDNHNDDDDDDNRNLGQLVQAKSQATSIRCCIKS